MRWAVAHGSANQYAKAMAQALLASFAVRWKSNIDHARLATICYFLDPKKRRAANLTLCSSDSEKLLDFCVGFLEAKTPGRTSLRSVVLSEIANCTLTLKAFVHIDGDTPQLFWACALVEVVKIPCPITCLLAVACTEAPVERAFSIEGLLVEGSPRLCFQLLDAEMRIKHNWD